MKTVQVNDKKFSLYISENEIKEQVKKVAAGMNEELAGKKPLFLVVLNGAFMFAADLLREIDIPCEVSFVRVSSYEGTTTTGKVKQLIGLNENIEGRTLVIVEDIIDSGITMREMLRMLKEKNPADVRVASLFVKPGNLQVELDIHYRCFDIANDFIVGYGLDYDQEGRNLPDIYKILE
ncbi:MAG: hypoxanthine phosphoribosyltransferase [Bacteroidales bacterium]|nr:hypoxanthine phosphoribosyltransferase [Bacteroidales bacterium]MBR2607948.1 hypoxanthine phosphoribosyltransferase [Bacteroidaceae bacterium]